MSNSIGEIKVGNKVRIYASGEHFMKVGLVAHIDNTVAFICIPNEPECVKVDLVELQKI